MKRNVLLLVALIGLLLIGGACGAARAHCAK